MDKQTHKHTHTRDSGSEGMVVLYWTCLHPSCQEQFVSNKNIWSFCVQLSHSGGCFFSFFFSHLSPISWGFTLLKTQKEIYFFFFCNIWIIYSCVCATYLQIFKWMHVFSPFLARARDTMSWNVPSDETSGWHYRYSMPVFLYSLLQTIGSFLFLFCCHTSGAM